MYVMAPGNGHGLPGAHPHFGQQQWAGKANAPQGNRHVASSTEWSSKSNGGGKGSSKGSSMPSEPLMTGKGRGGGGKDGFGAELGGGRMNDDMGGSRCHLFFGGVGNLISEQFVLEHFSSVGLEVETVRIPVDRESGRAKGYAFVSLVDPSKVRYAIESLSGREFSAGQYLVVQEAAASPQAFPRNQGVGGFAARNGIGGKASNWGTMQSWKGNSGFGGGAKGGRGGGSFNGPAFRGHSNFPFHNSFPDGKGFGGRGVGIGGGGRSASAGSSVADPNKLFVGNLSVEATEGDVRSALESVGQVVSVRILDGKLAGCGFVEFEDPKFVGEAIERLQGVKICGREVRLERQGERQGGVRPSRARGEHDHAGINGSWRSQPSNAATEKGLSGGFGRGETSGDREEAVAQKAVKAPAVVVPPRVITEVPGRTS